MEKIYLVFIILLFILAVSDLIVGVSNDAVNFLNSAVGSKAAPVRIIMLVAAAGVLFGTIFSGGMMEIARSGIFHPEKFSFSDIMLIFLAVMITDVILLDAFNTYGFPTSTTVSLVFELMGAAAAVAVVYISRDGSNAILSDYINTDKVIVIISGILLSVIIAFTAGTIIQFITRYIFSFQYDKRFKYLGGLFGGLAITTIVYFILIKGLRDAAFITERIYLLIRENSLAIMIIFFGVITAILYLLKGLFKINILKIVVLSGTFALALAFAGNDLVNFIGVPLAGYESYLTYIRNPGIDPGSFSMASLNDPVKTPLLFLLLSGIIMVITLYKSRKARIVILTEVSLGRQEEGYERFGSTILSRGIVRSSLAVVNTIKRFLPGRILESLSHQFKPVPSGKVPKSQPAFDLLRASVNLVVASALIALGTSLKLPLSTTYVTFMVAMGTSLADGAWGRESAVYRITGVFSVIGGWFFTAVSAFTISFLLAIIFFFGGFYAIFPVLGLTVFIVFRTHKFSIGRFSVSAGIHAPEEVIDSENFNEKYSRDILTTLYDIKENYQLLVKALERNSIPALKKIRKTNDNMEMSAKAQLKEYGHIIKVFGEQHDKGLTYKYVKALGCRRALIQSMSTLIGFSYDHVANNHKPLITSQLSELKFLTRHISGIIPDYHDSPDLEPDYYTSDYSSRQNELFKAIELFGENESGRIKKEKSGLRNSFLFMNLLQESRNLLNLMALLLKLQKDITGSNHKRDQR